MFRKSTRLIFPIFIAWHEEVFKAWYHFHATSSPVDSAKSVHAVSRINRPLLSGAMKLTKQLHSYAFFVTIGSGDTRSWATDCLW